MTDEDVWSLLSRQLYPSGAANISTPNHGMAGDAKEGDGEGKASGGEDTEQAAAEKEGITTAPCGITSFALCVGMPGAGKSSLLNAYLNPNNDGTPKPTVALEYMFARRASVANAPKVHKRDVRFSPESSG